MLPKTAIIGATGFVGKALLAAYRRHYPDTIGTCRQGDAHHLHFLDLRRPKTAPLGLSASGHKAALIVAAEPNVARCESMPLVTRSVNVVGTLTLIDQLLEEGVMPIFLSSDYVFDGEKGNYREEDATDPGTVYGAHKEEVEKELLKRSGGNCLIIRLSKLYDVVKGDRSLFDEMASLLTAGKQVQAAWDQEFNPMYLGDLAPALQEVQKQGYRGILHICGDQAWPRLEMARKLAETMGCDTGLVKRIGIADLGRRPLRPKKTSMSNAKLCSIYTEPLMTIEEALAKVASNYAP